MPVMSLLTSQASGSSGSSSPSGSSGIMGSLVGGLQAGYGLVQAIKAEKMRKKAQKKFEESPYQIPESAVRSVNKIGSLSQGTRMAGQSQLEEGIGAGTAQSIAGARRAAQSPSQILASTIASYGQQQAQQKQLDLAAQQDWQRRQENYAGAIATLAPYETKKWEYNTLYPYQSSMNASAMMSQAGMANIGQGIKSTLSSSANQQYLNSLNPQGTSGAASGVNTAYDNAPSMGMQPMTQLQPLRATGVTFGGG